MLNVNKRYTTKEDIDMMNELNKIWKEKTGKDLTEAEAWKMVDFVKMILENADKNIDKEQQRR